MIISNYIVTVSCDGCAHRDVCVQTGPMNVLKRDICQTVVERGVSPDFLSSISIKCSQYLAPQIRERNDIIPRNGCYSENNMVE